MKLAWQQIPSTIISELLCNIELDGVVIDTEHSAFNIETLYNCIQIITALNKTCFVRLTEPSKTIARACLDAGAHGIIFSTVETEEQCETIHQICKFPSQGGRRGLGLVRQNKWGIEKLISDKPIIIAQIETVEGIENLDKIVDRIKNGIGDYDMPVLFRNITLKGVFYPLILISGNHTRTAYYKTRDKNYGHTENKLLDCVVIDDDVHSQLQETEVHMLGNDLNADFNVGRAFCTKDAIDECMEHYKKGHSWKTNAMRKRFQVLGLTSGQADGVFKKVEDLIQKQELQRSGYMIYDYENTHSNLLEEKVEDLTDDTTFSLACSSGAPTLDRWMDKYIDEQIIRSEGGKPMQTKINVVVFHTSFRNRDKWDSLFERLTRPQHLSGLYKQLIGSVYKLPKFSYTEMKMSTKKIG